MNRFCILLRGINVSGQKSIKMLELREALHDAGLSKVSTYIQSGNIIAESSLGAASVANRVQQTIAQRWGFDVPTLAFDAKVLQRVCADSPFAPADPSKLHVMFLDQKVDKSMASGRIMDAARGDENFLVCRDVIYLHCPSGYSRTKLNNNFIEKQLEVMSTARNWKTVNKLLSMLAD